MIRGCAALWRVGSCLLVVACQTTKPAPSPATGNRRNAALRNMEVVATATYRCWSASNDRELRGYSFANELNSFTGRPLFLVVPKGNYGGRPLIVVQAEGPV